jgi:DNA-binding NtrC family response regulator
MAVLAPLPSMESKPIRLFHLGRGNLYTLLATIERDLIDEALNAAEENQTKAARRLGISRRALINKMERYGFKWLPDSSHGLGRRESRNGKKRKQRRVK